MFNPKAQYEVVQDSLPIRPHRGSRLASLAPIPRRHPFIVSP